MRNEADTVDILYAKMKEICAGIGEMEPYEFRYALDSLPPVPGGWAGVTLDEMDAIEQRVNDSGFYAAVQLKPRVDGAIVLDPSIVRLTTMLFAGLAAGRYPPAWVRRNFSFDVRGFFFLHRTEYFTPAVRAHFGGAPFESFKATHGRFEPSQAIGYRAFKEANREVDGALIDAIGKLVAARGTPILVAIAGPTAAGKTEIVERLREELVRAGRTVTSLEMDNFLTDRDERERLGIDSLGREAIHLARFIQSLEDIGKGRALEIPRYDFIHATSSHDALGNLKPGAAPLTIEPADVVFIEGNFPFLIEEVAALIAVKVVYLTDDEIRMKRKWRRDIDYRKKYDPSYFRNRFFKDQLLMARACFLPQLAMCDLAVDTTGAALWATPEVARRLAEGAPRG